MKKSFLLLLLLPLSFSFLKAQCVAEAGADVQIECSKVTRLNAFLLPQKINCPTTNNLNQISFINHDIGYIVGDSGTVLKTTNGGQAWNLTTLFPEKDWVTVSFPSLMVGYIADDTGTIAKTSDGGISWNIIYDDPSNPCIKLKFINENTGFLITFWGSILKTENGGVSWNVVSTGNRRLNDITFTSATKGFCAGFDWDTNAGLILVTTDGGNTWTLTGSLLGSETNIESVVFANENKGYAGSRYSMYNTTDGGLTWNNVNNWSEHCQHFDYVALLNDSIGFVAGENSLNSLRPDTSQMRLIYNTDETINSMICPDNQSMFLVCDHGSIYNYHNPVFCHWEPSIGLSADNIIDPVATPVKNTRYVVSLESENGCIGYDSVTVYVRKADLWSYLCMVTVDPESSHNKVIWEKSKFDAADSIYIYKEKNVLNQFNHIATFSATQSGEFIDEQSNSLIKSERYTSSILDKCSFECYLGNAHKTIHLSINQGVGTTWNLIWDQYEGAEVLTYNIYRGTSLNNLQLIVSLSGANLSFSDLSATAGNVFYQIEAIINTECSAFKTITSSFSNIAKYLTPGGFDYDEATSEFSISNNPVSDHFSIAVGEHSDMAGICLYSMNGKQIREWQHPSILTFDISDLPSGLYLLKAEMKNSRQCIMRKLLKL